MTGTSDVIFGCFYLNLVINKFANEKGFRFNSHHLTHAPSPLVNQSNSTLLKTGMNMQHFQ